MAGLNGNLSNSNDIIVPAVEKARSPGPAVYGASNIALVKSSSPKFTIASRSKKRPPQIPAANQYDRSNYKPGKAAPSYSFGRRYTSNSPLSMHDYIRH